mmetsp:Transcript_15773/g.36333  ORF Transcript_15773/g.36333 Transcript_15773/m.36333 type:complete len:123 (+) Transcript_15773:146-514(+)
MPSNSNLLNILEHQLGVYDGRMFDDIGRSREFCKVIAAKVESKEHIPIECKQYHEKAQAARASSPKPGGVTRDVRDVPHVSKYEGLSPHDAIDAKRAKAAGHLNEAQMIRRMTTRNNSRRFY